MLTYSSIPQKNHERQREYPWALLLLVFVWLWPGVFSHDLWKPTEPQLFYMIQETRFAWLPTFQDKPNFENCLHRGRRSLLQRRVLPVYFLRPWGC